MDVLVLGTTVSRFSRVVDQKEHETAVALMVEAGERAEQLRDDLVGRLGQVFARREPFQQARKYIQGLIMDLPRKNGWTLAEAAGDRSPDKTQRLLNHASWDSYAAMDIVRDIVMEQLGDPDDPYAVAVLDESGQEKKGTETFNVKRQYVGCAGRIANAINVVYCSYNSRRGHCLVGARPYIPKELASTPRTEAPCENDEGPVVVRTPASREGPSPSPTTESAPEPDSGPTPKPEPEPASASDPRMSTQFKTKPQLAIDLLTDLESAGVLPPWVTSDEVYGRDRALRTFLEDREVGYVLGVPINFTVALNAKTKTRVDKALGMFPAEGWVIDSCGTGSKGERLYSWAWIATASPRHHVLVRRNLNDPKDVAYFYCYIPAPRPQTLRALVRVAGQRWPVEEDFQIGKDQFGLDHSQVRLHLSLVRHIVLAMAALAICALTASIMRPKTSTLPPPPTDPDQEPPEDPGLVPLSVADTRRILSFRTTTPPSEEHHHHWILWKRRHQARARWFHQRTRLQRNPWDRKNMTT